MKVWFLLLVVTGMICGVAQADTVHLKNGNAVEGKVIENTADGVKVDIGGVTLTYYADEIASVDAPDQAAPASDPEPAPAAPVDVPSEPLPEVMAETPPPVVEAAPEPVVEAAIPAPVVEVVPVAVPEPVVEVPAVSPEPAVAAIPSAVMDDLADLSKQDLIKKFVQIYGVKENMQANFDQMTGTLKPDQAQAFRESVKVDEIVELLLPVYDKHFAADDLRAYIRFYSSTEGKKLVRALPLLMQDSVDVSMKYLDAHLPESLKQEQGVPAGE